MPKLGPACNRLIWLAVLQDEFLVVGSARMAEELDDWRLESLSDERDRCQQVHGRLLVLRVRSRQDGSCAASLFYQLAFPGPLHAVGTSSCVPAGPTGNGLLPVLCRC